MNQLLIHWAPSGPHSISVRTDFCCEKIKEAYGPHGPITSVPHYAIGLMNGMAIAYCPFCGAKVISINTETGERTVWSEVLK